MKILYEDENVMVETNGQGVIEIRNKNNRHGHIAVSPDLMGLKLRLLSGTLEEPRIGEPGVYRLH